MAYQVCSLRKEGHGAGYIGYVIDSSLNGCRIIMATIANGAKRFDIELVASRIYCRVHRINNGIGRALR